MLKENSNTTLSNDDKELKKEIVKMNQSIYFYDHTDYANETKNGMTIDEIEQLQMRYIKVGFTVEQAQIIYVALRCETKIDITKFADLRYDEEQMYQIFLGLKNNVDITKYNSSLYNAKQMEQLREGLEQQLDITQYANKEYEWRQMSQIKIGLLQKIDVSKYQNVEYDYQKMYKIRTKLVEEKKAIKKDKTTKKENK